MPYLIKASETSMYDKLGYYSSNTAGVLAYLQDMLILMRNADGTTRSGYDASYYIDLADVVSTYCATTSSYSTHSGFKDQYKYTSSSGASLFDCFMSDDGEDPATAYIEIKNFKITKNGTVSTFKLALKGTRPHFNKSAEVGNGWTLHINNNGLVYNSSDYLEQFTNVDNGVRPLRYICLLQGGGGGGSGTYGDHSGSGGGGGGFTAAYVHLTNESHTITIGSGGAGGYKGSGKSGGDTSISCSNFTISAKGGGGGGYGSGTQGAGTGATRTDPSNYLKTITTVIGGYGGVGDYAGGGRDGQNGSNRNATTLYCTDSNRADSKYSLTLAAKSGGKHQSNYGGGGGASQMGDGGNGGTPGKSSQAYGRDGSAYGGGGGGATYIFLTYIKGGAGAAGLCKIYY
jgi:hypothetical protein